MKNEKSYQALWDMFVKGEKEGSLMTRETKGSLEMPPTDFDNAFISQAKCYRKTSSKCHGFDKLG